MLVLINLLDSRSAPPQDCTVCTTFITPGPIIPPPLITDKQNGKLKQNSMCQESPSVNNNSNRMLTRCPITRGGVGYIICNQLVDVMSSSDWG